MPHRTVRRHVSVDEACGRSSGGPSLAVPLFVSVRGCPKVTPATGAPSG